MRIAPSPSASRPWVRVLAILWLACLSLAMALAITVAFFDRTTPAGVTGLWLGSLALSFVAIFLWWVRPRAEGDRVRLNRYEPVSLVCLTAPILLGCAAVVVQAYRSDEFHGFLYHHLYYRRLLTGSYWPVTLLAALFYGWMLIGTLRELLLRMGSGHRPKEAALATLSELSSSLPVGVLAIGLLLSTASLSMINVNFWRYWATADGWLATGHYPVTFTDAVHFQSGGVSKYFISFPLLPSMLVVSFSLLGHNTLAAYLPIILGNVLLPLAVFLTVREIARSDLMAFLFALLVASFPLLRSYTMDVGEADGLLMATVMLAAYFRLRADRFDSTRRSQLAAGLAAGLATLARPEGVLYVGAMYLAALKEHWRRGRFWLSVLVWGAVAAGFSAVIYREFRMVWPGNHSGALSLGNFTKTLDAVRGSGILGLYADALGLSQGVLGIGAGLLLVAVLASTVQMVRRDFPLIYMPVTALGNMTMVFFVGPVAAEATKFHDFFRHISYGLPLLAVTLAYGSNEILRRVGGRWGLGSRSVALAGLAALVFAQLSLLEGPGPFIVPTRGPMMTADVHVTAPLLLVDPYPLPTMRFRLSESRYVPDADEYMAQYPDNLNRYYAARDIRMFDNAFDYYRAAKLLFLGFLALALVSLLSAHLSLARRLAFPTGVLAAPASRHPSSPEPWSEHE